MKSSKSRMETDQCKLGSIQKYLEEYHYPHRNNHVINTATVKPQKKHWIILWSSLNLRYSLKISPMFNLKWNLFFKGFCKSDKRMPFDIIVFLRSYALTILSCKSDCKSSLRFFFCYSFFTSIFKMWILYMVILSLYINKYNYFFYQIVRRDAHIPPFIKLFTVAWCGHLALQH